MQLLVHKERLAKVAKTRASSQKRLLTTDFDPIKQFKAAMTVQAPWESIIDFAEHRSFCGKRLYPRQKTLLRLMFLETENMTAYDIDVIEEWRKGFLNKDEPAGVQPDIWERVDYLKEHDTHRHF